MILMLQPEQIAGFWDIMKHGIVVANRVAKVHEGSFCNRVLERLLSGKAQAWIGYTEREEEQIFHAFTITVIEEDDLTGEKRLYLHTVYAIRPITEDILEDIMQAFEKFCHEAECVRMYTLTQNDRLREYFLKQGFTQNTSLFVKEV